MLIIAGSFGIVLTANFSEVNHTVEDLYEDMTSVKATVYSIFVVMQMIFSYWLLKWLKR